MKAGDVIEDRFYAIEQTEDESTCILYRRDCPSSWSTKILGATWLKDEDAKKILKTYNQEVLIASWKGHLRGIPTYPVHCYLNPKEEYKKESWWEPIKDFYDAHAELVDMVND